MKKVTGAGLSVVVIFGLAACQGQQAADPVTTLPTATQSQASSSVTSSASSSPSVTRPVATPSASPAVPVQAGVLPDRSLTPGAADPAVTQATIHSTICVAGWTATVRPPSSYTTALKETQLADGYAYRHDTNPGDYEEDHLIPLELGGAPSDPRNLWPEPYAGPDGAHAKDAVENALRRDVCDGTLSLTTARQDIASGWTGQQPAAAPVRVIAPAPVQKSSPPTPTGCHPRSNAGNCYRAGEFCRTSDLGVSGRTASGEAIICESDGSRSRWLAGDGS